MPCGSDVADAAVPILIGAVVLVAILLLALWHIQRSTPLVPGELVCRCCGSGDLEPRGQRGLLYVYGCHNCPCDTLDARSPYPPER
jgi:hypothetical protein